MKLGILCLAIVTLFASLVATSPLSRRHSVHKRGQCTSKPKVDVYNAILQRKQLTIQEKETGAFLAKLEVYIDTLESMDINPIILRARLAKAQQSKAAKTAELAGIREKLVQVQETIHHLSIYFIFCCLGSISCHPNGFILAKQAQVVHLIRISRRELVSSNALFQWNARVCQSSQYGHHGMIQHGYLGRTPCLVAL